jgi:polysaccharide export outer membrane protein
MSSCSGFNQSFGRRAPIIATRYETVCDFLPIEDADEEDELLRAGRAPLLPEYFDPYQPIISDYVLSRGDILEVAVYGHDDTSVNDAVIAPDGKLYYLFTEPIQAEGLTIEQLQSSLAKELGDYFVTPDVVLTPKHVGRTTYNILGKVRRPGAYPINTSTTIQQAIGEAGGISVGGFAGTTINSSNLRESFIVRDGVKLNVDFERLIFTDGMNQNIFVRPGDYIYVASSLVQDVFLMGAVREQKPIPYKDGLTLSGLLAGSAGTIEGWLDHAHITEVLIVRGSLECPQTYQVNVLEILQGAARDIYLLPGDLVYVQPKPFKFGRALVRMAIQTFVSSFAFNVSSGVSNRDIFLNNTD